MGEAVASTTRTELPGFLAFLYTLFDTLCTFCMSIAVAPGPLPIVSSVTSMICHCGESTGIAAGAGRARVVGREQAALRRCFSITRPSTGIIEVRVGSCCARG